MEHEATLVTGDPKFRAVETLVKILWILIVFYFLGVLYDLLPGFCISASAAIQFQSYHNRTGHLFQSCYKSIVREEEPWNEE